MTKEELIKKLRECKDIGEADPEKAHARADDLLLEYIGDFEIRVAFIDIEKWYA